MRKIKLRSYTLAEIVIVMLVIAVVVAVTIKITKAKLDNITTYTYYSAYSTLKGVANNMVADFDGHEGKGYVSNACPENRFANNYIRLFTFIRPSKAFAVGDEPTKPVLPNLSEKEDFKKADLNSQCKYPESSYIQEMWCKGWKFNSTTCEFVKFEHVCSLPSQKWSVSACKCVSSPFGGGASGCSRNPSQWEKDMKRCSGYTWSPFKCDWIALDTSCPAGQHWGHIESGATATSACGCVEDKNLPTEEPKECSGTQPCGQQCDTTTGTWVADPDWTQPECSETQIFSETSCGCVPTGSTVPRTGELFCDKFASLVNTKSGSAECGGSAVNSANVGNINFSTLTPDLILRNNLKLYNLKSAPIDLGAAGQVLAGNYDGSKFINSDNVEVDANKWGYLVYVSIDGNASDARLWSEVFPFYVLLNGKVIPAYNMTANAEPVGGNSRNYLQVSVENETFSADGHRKISWIAKSVSFKEAACVAGYISQNTPYCSTAPAFTRNALCSETEANCRVKHIRPIKFF